MKLSLSILSIIVIVGCQSHKETPSKKSTAYYKLVWSDEFDYNGLPDASKWSYDVGDGCPRVCNWGNNEKQYYTLADSSNAVVRGGHLIITTRKDSIQEYGYSSARLITKGKGDWKYGQIEVRAMLPSGTGTWPAIWMLPTNNTHGGWPRNGEIDIMEHVGFNPDSIFGTIHCESYNHIKGTQKGGAFYAPDAESEFKIYRLLWEEDKIEWLVDDVSYFVFENEESTVAEWPFDQPFHLILNIAVGGNWGGIQGIDNRIFPQEMKVDYVRVYQNSLE